MRVLRPFLARCPFCLLVLGVLPLVSHARQYESVFKDSTLRLNYIFSGDRSSQSIYLEDMQQTPGWWGRRVNLDRLLLSGNGQILLTDTLGHDTLYRQSFSTLFQEWQATEEATHEQKAFENVFLVPMPREPILVSVTLMDTRQRVAAQFTHLVRPDDILIRQTPPRDPSSWSYLQQGGDSRDCIDIAFLPEGYRQDEMPLFHQDCQKAIDAMLSHRPFHDNEQWFNFIAVDAPSQDSGVSIPHKSVWRDTALQSHFDTFYSHRYLTTLRLRQLHDLLDGIPCEHIIVLANEEEYGGGGIFNSYMMSSAHNRHTRPVIVHEFGHSFAGLGDEYFSAGSSETIYPTDVEPWEPNLTTLVRFSCKWQDMLPEGTPVPTLSSGQSLTTEVGVYEGGGYQAKGIYRPAQECRMKSNEAPTFCPVCERAILRMIHFYTVEEEKAATK